VLQATGQFTPSNLEETVFMNRIKLALIAGGALIAAPAFADDQAEPAAGGTTEAGGEVQTPAGGAGAGMEATAGASGGATMAWPKEIIDRPLTVLAGKIGAGADLGIAHVSVTVAGMTASSTGEGLGLIGAYGVSDKLEVGGSYSFSLNEFEIKGPLTLFGNFNLTNNGKLAVGAGAGLVIDFAGVDAMGGSATNLALDAGLGVRFKLAPKFALFTGNPYAPGLLGNHLHLGLSGDEGKFFSIPVGFAMQATPELFAFIDTTIATILISDPGMGDRVSLISDFTPLNIGAWYAVNKNIDAGATISFLDVQHAGDFWGITLGARYFTN
jgi:hypothetical protein